MSKKLTHLYIYTYVIIMKASLFLLNNKVLQKSLNLLHKMPIDQIQYSEKYSDDKYEYRHVILPIELARHVPKTHLMSETEWRNLGVQQSPGWVHYMMHVPEIEPEF
ncbi:cyclin-dependent kinases regulatory subunit isoform X2 [Augochlora pura]